MGLGAALVGVAAGAAVARTFVRLRGAPDAPPAQWMTARASSVPAEFLDSCPACGADAVTFGWDEEVDAAGHAFELVRCVDCGWRLPLAPL